MPTKARTQTPSETLTWEQVTAWRTSRHFLVERAGADDLLKVTSRLCCLHAQMMSAAEISAWVRVDRGESDAVRKALWQDRTLVKTWAMRGTLHLVMADEMPLYVAARSTITRFQHPTYLKYYNLTLGEMNAMIDGVRAALDGQCLTREELASEVGRITGQERLGKLLQSGWGNFLKPAANLGYLCFGPSRGQIVTFVRPDQWLSNWQEIDPDTAMDEILRRYLSTYGPVTHDEYARWFGVQPKDVRPVFERIAGELTYVQVDDYKGWVLTNTLDDIRAAHKDETPNVRLLPNFDPYNIGFSPQIKPRLPAETLPRIYRTSGWISPVVLVDGEITGVWGYEKVNKGLHVTVDLFEHAPLTHEIARGIEAEAEHLTGLLGEPLELRFDTITYGG